MEKFFKVGNLVVDIEDGRIFDPNAGSMRLDFVNMTMKPFGIRSSRLIPIRFENQELLWWDTRCWTPFSKTYAPRVIEAIKALIEKKVEKELLG